MEVLLLALKTMHIVGFVAWTGGLFYLINLMVYHRRFIENQDTTDESSTTGLLEKMENSINKNMCNPAMMLTWTAGISMIFILGMPWFKENTWMHHKLLLLILLTVFHILTRKQLKKLKLGTHRMTTLQFKFFNFVPLLFLLSISILAIFKNTPEGLIPFLVVIFAMLLLFIFSKIKRNPKHKTKKTEISLEPSKDSKTDQNTNTNA